MGHPVGRLIEEKIVMNRKQTIKGGQTQGFVALNDQQLRQVEGGQDTFTLNFTKIEFTPAAQRGDVDMSWDMTKSVKWS